jgi:hypothetical protein
MIQTPSNDELKILLKGLKKGIQFTVKSRRILDQNPYAILEVLDFVDIPAKSYILKSVVPAFRHEIAIHRYASNFKLNGAQFIFGHSADLLQFILMEKIDDLIPIHFIDPEESRPYFTHLAQNLAKFHLESVSKLSSFKTKGVSEYGVSEYLEIIKTIGFRIKRSSEEMDHPYYLPQELILDFLSSLRKVQKPLQSQSKGQLSLIHGDFDFGNIFVKNINEICVLDWGMGRIDHPIIDIANLLNGLQSYGVDFQSSILQAYLKTARPLIDKKVEVSSLQFIGTLMHLFFFLDYQLNMIASFIDPMYYIDQIHREVTQIIDLVNNQQRL